jgi:DNA invertase Pin-like site-specific DNA recombinase
VMPDGTAPSVGFVALTEALDLTTPPGRDMAGMLVIFAEFEREISLEVRDRNQIGRVRSCSGMADRSE